MASGRAGRPGSAGPPRRRAGPSRARGAAARRPDRTPPRARVPGGRPRGCTAPAAWATASSPVAARQTSGGRCRRPPRSARLLTIRTGASPRRAVRAASSTARRWRRAHQGAEVDGARQGRDPVEQSLGVRRLLTMQSIRGAAAKRRATVSSGVARGCAPRRRAAGAGEPGRIGGELAGVVDRQPGREAVDPAQSRLRRRAEPRRWRRSCGPAPRSRRGTASAGGAASPAPRRGR